jgi:uncharacterized membrane protein
MQSKAKLAGHPIHPMLVVFPLGLLVIALVFDFIYLATGNPAWSTVAFYNIAAGVIGGLLAAIPGLVDWIAIPRGTRAKAIGLYHAVGNVVVLALFVVSWAMRWGDPGYRPGASNIVLECLAIALALVTGWLGGELVDRLGIGVDEGANPDAPSSLTHEPARGPLVERPT